MKCTVLLFLMLLFFEQAYAQIKPCWELKVEIAAKLDAAGVQSYELTIVKNEQIENGMVLEGEIVGSCEGGTKKIIYTKRQVTEEPKAVGELPSSI